MVKPTDYEAIIQFYGEGHRPARRAQGIWVGTGHQQHARLSAGRAMLTAPAPPDVHRLIPSPAADHQLEAA